MALRELIDDDGTEWVVFAVQPSISGRATGGTRPELSRGWLCFQSATERRRMPGIPDAWDVMADGALLALLASAPAEYRVDRGRRR
jgi:hypothetical protein